MTYEQKIEAIATAFGEEVSEIKPETKIDNLIFDSVAKMALIAMLNEKCDKQVSVSSLKSLVTIQDILNLM